MTLQRIKKSLVERLQLREHRRRLFETFGSGRYSHLAHYGTDYVLEKYLNFRGGTFVELGAYDGLTASNTYFFEAVRGWRGVLIEPIPPLAEQARKNRPRAQVFNSACVAFDFPERSVEMTFSGIMSVVNGSFQDDEAERKHIATSNEWQGIQSYQIRVPARTLTSIIEEAGLKHIDLLSLDVEGYELSVLRGLDFERFAPSFMLIEARFRDEIEAFLKERYEVAEVLGKMDVLYRLKR